MYVTEELKVLLLMPYFERPNMVLNALRGFENIKYSNYEICIIDDGSTKNPIEDVIKKNNINLKNIKIFKTNDTLENKFIRGSIHGTFMNLAIKESDADLVVMMSDDDVVIDDYFKNLNDFYLNNKNIMYSYCHIIPFDPLEQIPCKTLANFNHNKVWNTYATTNLNWTYPVNPFCKLDSTQVSWRRSCNVDYNIWFPEVQTKNLDASFYELMFRNFGNCIFNSLTGIYKGFHVGQLGNSGGEKQFSPIDCQKKTNYFSICSSFKNQSKDLQKWLDYHINIGVDHFYLYDNDSTDNYREVLKKYYDDGFLTLIKMNGDNVKEKIHNHFNKNYKFKTFWVTFLEINDYINLEKNNFKEFIKKQEESSSFNLEKETKIVYNPRKIQ